MTQHLYVNSVAERNVQLVEAHGDDEGSSEGHQDNLNTFLVIACEDSKDRGWVLGGVVQLVNMPEPIDCNERYRMISTE